MIRFKCPGCSAAITAPDDRAGKRATCPKCTELLSIPDAAAPVEIAPCPECGEKLSVAAEDLGTDVECPECDTVFRAKRPKTVPVVKPTATVASDFEIVNDDDEVPTVQKSRPKLTLDDDDDDDRPRRRRDDDFEDDDDQPRKKRKKKKRLREDTAAIALLVRTSFILGVLCLVCGGLNVFALSLLDAAKKQGNINDDELALYRLLAMIQIGIFSTLAGTLLIGGIGAQNRKSYGRTLLLIAGGLCVLISLLRVYDIILLIKDGDAPKIGGAIVAICIFVSYAMRAFKVLLNPDNAAAFE